MQTQKNCLPTLCRGTSPTAIYSTIKRKEMKSPLALFALCLMLATGCQDSIVSDQVKKDFQERTEKTPCNYAEKALDIAKDKATREALAFLYAYMSWPDIVDYPPYFHVAQTECALRAREEMPWGKTVPNREWLHFVLPVRVNNEHLDNFRTTCYEELKERVAGLSMEEAVLEVNHWCHEYVTYKPSDARTSTPLQSMKTGYGRCGEESTFTVAALRAIGIPARQVYTPRWAHTDDNHAWVEAWINGKWYFLGACEPEPVLNLAWFNQPASRAILMHTRAFGAYDGPEDVMNRTACFTEINVTENYADVASTQVCVVDTTNRPIAHADIAFKVYNYAELYTVMKTQTDEKGMAQITAGIGDLVAWASDGKNFGYRKFSVGKESKVDVVLKYHPGDTIEDKFNIIPPVGKHQAPEPSAEETRKNIRRLAIEDSIRSAYQMSFPDSTKIAAFCQRQHADFRQLYPLVTKSCGNYNNVFDLYKKHGKRAIDILNTLSEKDLRDFELSVLDNHLQHTTTDTTRIYLQYILCPRIANEHLTPWRSYFLKAFNAADRQRFKEQPEQLAAWIRDSIATDTVWNPLSLCLSPENAHRFALADRHSKGLLFVAAARSLNIPARIDGVTGKVQYGSLQQQDNATGKLQWHAVELDAKTQKTAALNKCTETGKLQLHYQAHEYMENPKYYHHFTLSKINRGFPVLQEYKETATWESPFKKGVTTDAGQYLLTSGTRMADGSVLAHLSTLNVFPGQTTDGKLVMREDKTQIAVIGSFNSENKYYDLREERTKSILATTGRGYFVVGLIRANHEPTNHILHDIAIMRRELGNWGRTILLLFPSAEEYKRFTQNRAEFIQLPPNVRFGIDSEGEIARDLFTNGLTRSKELPLIIIGDTFNRVVFKEQGYTIGMGEHLLKTINKL